MDKWLTYFVIYHRSTMQYGHYQSTRIEAANKQHAANLAVEYYDRTFEDSIIVDGVVPESEWRTW